MHAHKGYCTHFVCLEFAAFISHLYTKVASSPGRLGGGGGGGEEADCVYRAVFPKRPGDKAIIKYDVQN